MGQEEDPPTNLSNHGRKGRASSPLVKYLEMGVFLSRSASDLPSFGALVALLSGGKPSFFGWQKSPFRKARNFCAHENKFPHMRKYFFLYTEIFFLPHGSFSPFGRRCFSFRREPFFPSDEEKFSCLRKLIFLRRKNPLRSKGKSLAFEGKRSAVRRAIFFRTYGNKFSYVRKYFFLRAKNNFLTYGNFGPSPSALFAPAEAFPEPS